MQVATEHGEQKSISWLAGLGAVVNQVAEATSTELDSENNKCEQAQARQQAALAAEFMVRVVHLQKRHLLDGFSYI